MKIEDWEVMVEQRLHNIELAIVALAVTIQSGLPQQQAEVLESAMEDFFNHSYDLGAFREEGAGYKGDPTTAQKDGGS